MKCLNSPALLVLEARVLLATTGKVRLPFQVRQLVPEGMPSSWYISWISAFRQHMLLSLEPGLDSSMISQSKFPTTWQDTPRSRTWRTSSFKAWALMPGTVKSGCSNLACSWPGVSVVLLQPASWRKSFQHSLPSWVQAHQRQGLAWFGLGNLNSW